AAEHGLLRRVPYPADLGGRTRPGAAAEPQDAGHGVLPNRGVLPLHHLDRGDRRGVEHALLRRERAHQPVPDVDRYRNVPGWTVSTTWAMPAIIIVGTWREMGYFMLL